MSRWGRGEEGTVISSEDQIAPSLSVRECYKASLTWEIPFVLFKMVTTMIVSYPGECSLTDNVKGIARIH